MRCEVIFLTMAVFLNFSFNKAQTATVENNDVEVLGFV